MAEWHNTDTDYTPADSKITFQWFQPDSGGMEIAYANEGGRLNIPVNFPWSWSNIIKARRLFLGYPKFKTDGTKSWISRQLPIFWPGDKNLAGNSWLYAVSAPRVVGLGQRGNDPDTGLPVWDTAQMWLTFSDLSYDFLEDSDVEVIDVTGPLSDMPDESLLTRYITRRWSLFDRILSQGRGNLKWVLETGDPLPSPANPNLRMLLLESFGRSEIGIEEVITWHQIPVEAIPRKAIQLCVNCVNNAEFDGFPAETLLCKAPRIRPWTSPLGQRIYDIEYRFMNYVKFQKSSGTFVGHNHFLHWINNKLDYRRLTTTGHTSADEVLPDYPAGDPPYRLADFRTLFRPDQP